MADNLKERRKRILTSLTRTRRNVYVLIDSRGSRSQVASYLPELSKIISELEEVNDKFSEYLVTEDEKAKASQYFTNAEGQYQEAITRIQGYLTSRKDEPPSVASDSLSQASKASQGSAASRSAEISAKVKQLETSLLEERLKQERQEREMQQRRKLQEAKDAQAVAELHARLTKAAEDDLSWERRNDFTEEGAGENQPSATAGQLQGVPPSSTLVHSLPRLTLPKFTGEPGEWPRWYALFKTLVHDQVSLTQTEKMLHLQSSVVGIAQHTIAGMMCEGALYEEALRTLRDRFGREEDVIHSCLEKVFSCPPPMELDPVSLERFHASVHCAVTVFQNLGYRGDLESFENLRRIVEKLPSCMRRDWGEHVLDMEPTRPSLVSFDDWLRRQVRISLNYARVNPDPRQPAGSTRRPPQRPRAETRPAQRTTLKISASAEKPECFCQEREHWLNECPMFLELSLDERAQTVADNGRCFFCLRSGHILSQCESAKPCGQEGCRMSHHKVLHGSKRVTRRYMGDARGDSYREVNTSDRVVAASSRSDSNTTLLQVVPVRVVGTQGQTRTVCALLDPGSQTSLCCEDVVARLGLKGKRQPLCLQNVEGAGAVQNCQRLSLELMPETSDKKISVPEVFAVKSINLTVPHIQKKGSWAHLRDLNVPDLSGQKVEMLLGANVLEAVLQLEAKVGRPGEPVAIRTAFGWTLTGSVSSCAPGHLRSVMLLRKAETISELVQDWWTTEGFGCKFDGEAPQSLEDVRALKIMEDTTRKVDGRYEVGLLWRDEEMKMPDNWNMAHHRLQRLERSLRQQPEKAKEYDEALMGYVEKGHARKIALSEPESKSVKRWYLPHHAVVNPNKAKVRVVFDAAAEYAGTSLNSALLTGPDMLQNLVGVLLRFREERIALVADVEQMFHQVRVREEDQPALSFLWRNLNQHQQPEAYQMQVVIFGAKCSPTLANHVLQKTAEDHGTDLPESRAAVEAVKNNFYMDDFLRSEKNVHDAKKMQKEVTKLVSQGGFRLTKWLSNRSEVLEDITEESRSPSALDLTSLGKAPERALGCVWKPNTDMLAVKSSPADVPPTKRGVLKRVAMIFDPQGFVSPVVLRAKRLVQQLWSLKYGWDDPLQGSELAAWETWITELTDLERIEVPRCFKADIPADFDVSRYELHVFCDASEIAFGAVAYLRMTTYDGTHTTSFVMSKTRLAPMKQLTIVRLELQAAVLGVRLAGFVKRELTYPISEVCYWTDSKVVLQFLQNESRRFHTFVANRVSEIQDVSSSQHWHHVSSELNPADICSRGGASESVLTSRLWWKGPEFLRENKNAWSDSELDPCLDPRDPEVKTPARVVFSTQSEPKRLWETERFSSWQRMKRTAAWVLRFVHNARLSRDDPARCSGPLSVEELRTAESAILRESQYHSFRRELEKIKRSGQVPKGSCLQHLTPFIDSAGLIRAAGRTGRSALAWESCNPVVLGKDADVLRLIVHDAHNRVMHAGLEHTLSEVRVSFYIPKARSVVKKITRHCQYCKIRRACPRIPRMGDLPEERVRPSRPFECCALDYIGPMQVKRFRKTEKRYILLVTCLATRAIHLELTSSLTADCFLMGFRRFIARRGQPRVVMSDNGTNIVAGEKELREGLKTMNQTQVSEELHRENIEWKFIPPTASHMGGVWERLVASVKRSLRVVLGNQCVSEDVLQTVLTEVEFMVNSRPLTYVSGDINDPEPLTPNHFLLGMPQAAVSPGVFSEREVMSRSKWRQSQALSEQLWRRWQKEYLPLLLTRKKWNDEQRNFREGDLVLIVEDISPRGLWPKARVIETYPGEDGRVRSVRVKTASGSVYHRPVSKLCFIESCEY